MDTQERTPTDTTTSRGRRHSTIVRGNRPPKQRVLLVDDHPMTMAGVAGLINQQPDLEVCGEASCAFDALQALSKKNPCILVTDLTMPGGSGIEFLKDVHALSPDLPVLVFSMHDELLYAERALRAGARGYVMKDAGAARLLEAIRLVLNDQICVSPGISQRLLGGLTGQRRRRSASPIEKLSDREFQILRLLGRGNSTKEVAHLLCLSPKTVDVHRAHIKERLGLPDGAALLHFAARWVQSEASEKQ